MKNPNRFINYIEKSLGILIILLWIIAFVIFPYPPLISILKTGFYLGNHNGFVLPLLNENPIFFWIYLLVILITASIFYVQKAFLPKGQKFYDVLLFVTVFIFINLVGFQTMSQHKFFSETAGIIHLNLDRKLHLLLGDSYRFAKYGQKLFSYTKSSKPKMTGKLITDLDLSQTVEPYILRYVLYPKIDIISPTDSPECLVVYQKSNPENSIPSHYKIVGIYNKSGLYAQKE